MIGTGNSEDTQNIPAPSQSPRGKYQLNDILRSELLGHDSDRSYRSTPSTSTVSSHSSSAPNLLKYKSSVEDAQRYGSMSASSSPGAPSPYRSHSLPSSSLANNVDINLNSRHHHSSPSLGPNISGSGGGGKQRKKISRVPYKVLDAPSLQDDFYLNLVDWSKSNILAVGLGSSVYLWSAYTSKVVYYLYVCALYRISVYLYIFTYFCFCIQSSVVY